MPRDTEEITPEQTDRVDLEGEIGDPFYGSEGTTAEQIRKIGEDIATGQIREIGDPIYAGEGTTAEQIRKIGEGITTESIDGKVTGLNAILASSDEKYLLIESDIEGIKQYSGQLIAVEGKMRYDPAQDCVLVPGRKKVAYVVGNDGSIVSIRPLQTSHPNIIKRSDFESMTGLQPKERSILYVGNNDVTAHLKQIAPNEYTKILNALKGSG